MIIVGLTTIPERLEKGIIKKCIKSMLKQTIQADYIVVNIPKISFKGVKYNYHAAHELLKLDKKIIIRWGIKDEGPITKLFGTLDFIKSKGIINGKIILVDDDVEYNKLVIEYLISKNYPAVGFVGVKPSIDIVNNKVNDIIYYDEHHNLLESKYINFLETFASVCYDIKLFNINNMRSWAKQLPPDTFYVDDIVIGAWLWKNNVIPCIISIPNYNLKLYNHDAENTPELSSNNMNYRNIKVLSELYSLGYFQKKKNSFSWYKINYCKIIIIFVFIILLIIYFRNKMFFNNILNY
jgi:hypothetical protein